MFSLSRPRAAGVRTGFTLLELLIVVVIIGIVATLLIPVYSQLRARAQKVQCIANLHSLYVAADVYVQQQRHWPQLFLKDYASIDDYANAWITTLAPYGPDRKTWICPTIQDSLRDPDYTQPHQARLDYVSTAFDDKQTSPHQWRSQPWFVETGNVHGNGNLLILTDGSIAEMNDVLPK